MTDTQPAISIRDLTFTYRIREEPAIHNINLELHPGELMLMVGASGSGKSTIMRAINGLIPRTYRGTMDAGSITLFGKDVNDYSMAELSQTVGTLLQDPERQIVTSKVLNEVAFGLENLALPREEILQRVDETLSYLNIMKLRERETFRLSGGEKQIVGVAGVLAMRPRILLLDEPLASLDPASAHESLRIFRELANQGIAVLLVEHRVDDALAIDPDTVVYLEEGRIVYSGSPDGLMQTADFHRVKLPAAVVMQRAKAEPPPVYKPAVGQTNQMGSELVRFQNVSFRYSKDTPTILQDINFSVRQGDIIALLGPNGAGKTTLVKHVLGLLKPTNGQVLLEGVASKDSTVATAAKTVGYVFQNPSQMLFAPSVQEELAYGPTNLRHDKARMAENISWALETIHMSEYRDSPPLALSYGQQKRVSI
ncbi:MAG: ABC transporter ATP-binding protein, partial [Anaerolineales bacterium]|nr:ABC transporter ATP-binding protein [Anaerolineales bacterium]